MQKESAKYAHQRADMVKKHIRSRGISDSRVLAAFREVPRHLFVSEALRDQAYGDYPLPIGEGQTISQPYIVAEMTQALRLTADDRVLEIGTGSGYHAAILSKIVYRVYTIERHRALLVEARRLFQRLRYHNIVSRRSDGTSGWPEESPFDAIVITAAAPRIPQILIKQLSVGGRMILPVGGRMVQDLVLLHKREKDVKETNLGGCRFVKLIGEHGW
jgi:protein-L-isoaspartate(D-aspartate) O-methyltransferase